MGRSCWQATARRPLADTGRSGRAVASRLQAALAVIEAEQAAVAAAVKEHATAALDAAQHWAQTARTQAQHPAAALARAQADHQAALARAEAEQAERAVKVAAAPPPAASWAGFAPGPDRALARAEAALAAARQAAQTAPPAVRQANVTDPDSRIMKTPHGWVQGYNAQAIANQHQIVLACDVSQDTGDVELYQPMMTRLADTLAAAGITAPVGLALANAGYWSEANATALGPERLIATIKDHKQRRAARDLGQTTGPPPHDATPIDAMDTGYGPRKEPPPTPSAPTPSNRSSQNRKHNREIRSFRRRGLDAAKSEWALTHLAGNLLKLRQHRTTAPTA